MLAAALTVDVSISTLVAIVVLARACVRGLREKDRDTTEERFSATLVLEEFGNSFYNYIYM